MKQMGTRIGGVSRCCIAKEKGFLDTTTEMCLVLLLINGTESIWNPVFAIYNGDLAGHKENLFVSRGHWDCPWAPPDAWAQLVVWKGGSGTWKKGHELEWGHAIWLKLAICLIKVEKEISFGNERIWDSFILLLLFIMDLFSNYKYLRLPRYSWYLL